VICYVKKEEVVYISEAVDNEGFYEREFYIREDGEINFVVCIVF
jgi:hypothetical protein